MEFTWRDRDALQLTRISRRFGERIYNYRGNESVYIGFVRRSYDDFGRRFTMAMRAEEIEAYVNRLSEEEIALLLDAIRRRSMNGEAELSELSEIDRLLDVMAAEMTEEEMEKMPTSETMKLRNSAKVTLSERGRRAQFRYVTG